MSGPGLGPRDRCADAAPRAAGRDVTDETTPRGWERGGGPRVIYRWPGLTTLRAPARDLAGMLDDVTRYIRRYVVLSDSQAVACTLWVAHTSPFKVHATTFSGPSETYTQHFVCKR